MAGGLFDALYNDEGESEEEDEVFLMADDSPTSLEGLSLEQLPNVDVSARMSGVEQFCAPCTSTDVGHLPVATPGGGGALGATKQAMPNMATNQAMPNMATNQAMPNMATNQAMPIPHGGGARSPASMHAPGVACPCSTCMQVLSTTPRGRMPMLHMHASAHHDAITSPHRRMATNRRGRGAGAGSAVGWAPRPPR